MKLLTLPTRELEDTHVASSASMIRQAVGRSSTGQALVLGAGNCNEIPLPFLLETFARVDIVEWDLSAVEAMERKIAEYGYSSKKCTIYQADIAGLMPAIDDALQETVAQACDEASCLEAVGCLIGASPTEFWSPPDGQRYDLVISSVMFTQLPAALRERIDALFANRFPDSQSMLFNCQSWKNRMWDFTRRLEEAFVRYLRRIVKPQGIVYFSATTHVCWLLSIDADTVGSEGSWVATRTSRLADYLSDQDVILDEKSWQWLNRYPEGPFWGQLFGVQGLIFRPGLS